MNKAPVPVDVLGLAFSAQTETGANEHILVSFRSHGRRLFFPVMTLLVVSWVVGFFVGNIREDSHVLFLLSGASLIVFLFVIFPYFVWLGTRYTITSQRIIMRKGILVRVRHEIPFVRCETVSVRSTVIQRLFRAGTIVLTTGSDKKILLRDVPSARLVSEALNELIDVSVSRHRVSQNKL